MTIADKSPKTIATINFKGGIGKTTVTWCLGDVLSSMSNERVLMFDLDAQMSLTQAISLNEDSGNLLPAFSKWYESAIQHKRTIFDALDASARLDQRFDFAIKRDFVYDISDQFHFVPSVEDLYWLELEVFDRESVKDFIRRLLGKITNSAKLPTVRERVASLNLADLNLLRQELGVSLGKRKPNQRVLVDAVMARINESLKLTHHVSRRDLLEESSSGEK